MQCFYAHSQHDDIRQKQNILVSETTLPTGLQTINLTIAVITSVLYKISLTIYSVRPRSPATTTPHFILNPPAPLSSAVRSVLLDLLFASSLHLTEK